MRSWASFSVAIAIGGLLFVSPVPAGAASKVPTADQLVTKLVKAGFCDTKVHLDASGTTVRCTARIYTYPGKIDIHAYRTKKAMTQSLNRALAQNCALNKGLSDYGYVPKFRVGKYWWTDPFRDLEAVQLAKIIGGKLTSYGCT